MPGRSVAGEAAADAIEKRQPWDRRRRVETAVHDQLGSGRHTDACHRTGRVSQKPVATPGVSYSPSHQMLP